MQNTFRLWLEEMDGKPIVYQLYTPEPDQYKDPNMYLWVRRCELFTSPRAVLWYFKKLNIHITSIRVHELFPDLTIITDRRGYQWYCCKAPINGV